MKTNLTPDMAIYALSDIKCIRDFFNGGYERQCKEPTCDKYKRGFNIDDRFSGTGKHALNILQRIIITALAFWIGVLLMPLAPFLMAWMFWGETDGKKN